MSETPKGSRSLSLGLRLVGEFSVIVLGVLVALAVEGMDLIEQELDAR